MTNFENRPEELSQPSINIQNASNEDIEGILDVQSQNLIVPETDENQDQSKQSGFLVNPVSAENLTEIIEEGQNHILKVAKKMDKLSAISFLTTPKNGWKFTQNGWEISMFRTAKNKN